MALNDTIHGLVQWPSPAPPLAPSETNIHLVVLEPEGEVWDGLDRDENVDIRSYLGDFAADYTDTDIATMGAAYWLKVETRAAAEGERNSAGELVLPTGWLANMPEAHWLDDINGTIQDFDEARVH